MENEIIKYKFSRTDTTCRGTLINNVFHGLWEQINNITGKHYITGQFNYGKRAGLWKEYLITGEIKEKFFYI